MLKKVVKTSVELYIFLEYQQPVLFGQHKKKANNADDNVNETLDRIYLKRA
jgi:hypothetical protein